MVEVTTGTLRQRRLLEQKYINKQKKINWDDCYNLLKKTIVKKRKYWSANPEETKEKIRKSWTDKRKKELREKYWTEERRKEVSKRSKKLWENEEYRNYMQAAKIGKKRSAETKEKLRNQKLGEKNPMFGKDFSKEHREKMGIARRGKKLKPMSEEAKKKLSKSRKGKGCYPCSEEKKKKLSIANKGKRPADITLKKAAEKNAKTYNVILLDPSGKEYKLEKNAAEFCRKYNLHIASVNKLINKKAKHHRGWTVK